MKWPRYVMVCALLMVLATPTRGVPPPSVPDEIAVPSTMTRDLVRHLHLGKRVAEFEKTTLGELAEWLGGGSVEHDGDAARSRTWVCYSLPGQLVWFVSTEMGGSENSLMEVVAEAVSRSDSRLDDCPKGPGTLLPIALEFGWIGSSEASIRKALGAPSGARGEWSQYFYAGKQSGSYQASGDSASREVQFDVTAFVELKFRNGKVVAVRASHVTSY